jgi:hypothetical protein
MQDEIKVSEGYQPTHQFISFVEGSSSEAPDESSYPLQVLEADHNLNHLDGGDPTDGFAPWVSDILVYPSSEYWEGQLKEDRIRPYFDLSISNYNTLRIPSAVHNYNLYVDNATIYDNLIIQGSTQLAGKVEVTGEITPASIKIASDQFSVTSTGEVTAEAYKGFAETKSRIVELTDSSYVVTATDTGKIFNCNPSGDIEITLGSAEEGTTISVMNIKEGSICQFFNLVYARGTILSEQYSAATLYFTNGAWYGFGDLV